MGKNVIIVSMVVTVKILINYRLFNNVIQEYLELTMLACIIIHLWHVRHWFMNLVKGKQTLIRLVITIESILLLISMIATFGSAILISETTLPLAQLTGRERIVLHEIHQGSAYASFLLIATHVGLH